MDAGGGAGARDDFRTAPMVVFQHSGQLWDVARHVAANGGALVAMSARHLHGSLGVGWFRDLSCRVREHIGETPLLLVLDCDDHVGHALRALRLGQTVRVRGQERTLEGLRAQAALCSGTLFDEGTERPTYVLGVHDELTAFYRWYDQHKC